MSDKYFIKADYVENNPIPYDGNKHYSWNEARIRNNFYANYYVYKYARKLAEENQFNSVLDIGCGAGAKLNHFFINAGFNVVAIDNEEAISYCLNNYDKGKFISLDLSKDENIKKISDKGFDLIVSVDVIEHLEKPENFFEFIKLNSTKESVTIISTPERDIVRGKKNHNSPNRDHIREWNMSEFRRLIENYQFTMIDHFLSRPIKPNFSVSFIKNLLYYLLNFRRFLGTQVAVFKIKTTKI